MKNFHLPIMKGLGLTHVLISFYLLSSAQDYKPFPLLNACWREGCGGIETTNCSQSQIETIDTFSMDGYLFSYLEKSGLFFLSTWETYCTDIPISWFSEDIGCIRNDTLNKRVYIRPYCDEDEEDEYLMYDFNLELGDTVANWYGIFFNQFYIVTDIDSLNLTDGWHKRFILQNNGDDELELIEGIGCTTTFEYFFPFFESGCFISCQSINGEVIYSRYNSGICDKVVPVDVTERFSELQIFPNPANDQITIDIQNLLYQRCDIVIYNEMGQIVYAINNQRNSIISIATVTWPSGIYNVVVKETNKDIIRHRVAILH